jgi:telomerase reverse transcriptase
MRLIDDYLYITTNKSNAAKFLATMNEGLHLACFLANMGNANTTDLGHPEYGCFVSKDKTLTNFDFDADVMNVTLPGEKCA